jgi:hypothetical protein
MPAGTMLHAAAGVGKILIRRAVTTDSILPKFDFRYFVLPDS